MRKWSRQAAGWTALSRSRNFATVCLAVLSWILAGFGIADPDLSPNAVLGGAKALLVVLAVLLTLLAVYQSGWLGTRD